MTVSESSDCEVSLIESLVTYIMSLKASNDLDPIYNRRTHKYDGFQITDRDTVDNLITVILKDHFGHGAKAVKDLFVELVPNDYDNIFYFSATLVRDIGNGKPDYRVVGTARIITRSERLHTQWVVSNNLHVTWSHDQR